MSKNTQVISFIKVSKNIYILLNISISNNGNLENPTYVEVDQGRIFYTKDCKYSG